MTIQDSDSAQVAHALLNLKDGGQVGEFDKALAEKYGITFDNFHKLICDLAPLCDKAWSNKHGWISGFADDKAWLAMVVGKDEI